MKFIGKKFWGILISLIFIGIIISQVDTDKAVKSFSLINPIFILPIIPVYMLAFVTRAFRWKIFLHKGDLRFNSLLSSIFIGFSLNCMLPARAGEIYRAYFFSKKENLNKTKVFTSVILERIFDGFTLFMILVTAIYFVCPGDLFSKIAFSAGLIFFSGFVFLLVLAKMQDTGNKREKIREFFLLATKKAPLKIKDLLEKIVNKLFSILNSFIGGLAALDSWKLLVKSVFYSFLIWMTEGAFMFLVIKSFGIDISFLGGLLVLTVTAFSTLIPAGPAGVGPYQWGYMIALGVFGIEPELGLAVSVINQLLSIILILLAGSVSVWKEHINFDEIKQNLQEKQESPEY